MRYSLRSTFWVAFAVIACSGTSRTVPASAGTTGASAVASAAVSAPASGEPAWVSRGSAAFNNAGERAFYGVGAASGIRNPSLLRSTVDNRARAELAKVFEVFSASLMKDYSASSGEQAVEQAVKTFSGMSLEGVEIRDRYVARDGTMYSLAVLDLATMGPAIAKAKASGLVKPDTSPVNLDDIFDRGAKMTEKPKPVAATSGTSVAAGGEKPPTATTSDTKTTKGSKPGWIDGEDARFPLKVYLCAVGYGPKRELAESGAYTALSKIFAVNVQSASEDLMSAYSQTGAPSLDIQSSSTLTRTSTEKLLTAVRIPEVWEDPRDKTLFALSCIERAKNAKILGEQIADLDSKVKGALDRASAADPQNKLKELSRALDTLVQREALNNELRIIDFDGVGIPSPYAPYDISASLEAAQDQLHLGVKVEGQYADDFRTAIIEGLTKAGYKVEEGEGTAFDVLITAKVRLEDGGAGTDSAANLHFVRGVVLMELKNVSTGKIIGSFNENRKEGHRSQAEAERKAVRELGKRLAGLASKKIDAVMKGKS
jgi:hypothetical protein